MKKIKICGVSLCTLLAATGANAAGYTCDELIEYTSCMPGYYLSSEDGRCPDGYVFKTDVCDFSETNDQVEFGTYTKEQCLGADTGADKWWDAVCIQADTVSDDMAWDINDLVLPSGGLTTTCSTCPVGSICAGGAAVATPCPAGSYCATAGLSEPTNLCAKGTYSGVGATACTSCPSSGLTDANGSTVSVTTESTGSTSSSACFVAKGTLFKDNKGTYRYTDNCKFTNPTSEQEACAWNQAQTDLWCQEMSDDDERQACMADYSGNCGCDNNYETFVYDPATGSFSCVSNE